jgi:hypothetical protein
LRRININHQAENIAAGASLPKTGACKAADGVLAAIVDAHLLATKLRSPALASSRSVKALFARAATPPLTLSCRSPRGRCFGRRAAELVDVSKNLA